MGTNPILQIADVLQLNLNHNSRSNYHHLRCEIDQLVTQFDLSLMMMHQPESRCEHNFAGRLSRRELENVWPNRK